MTETTTAPRKLTQTELVEEAMRLFGVYPDLWRFRCPLCGHTQCANELPKERRQHVAQACFGCGFLAEHAAGPSLEALWRVQLADGRVTDSFPLADGLDSDIGAPSQPPQGAHGDSAGTPGPESATDAPDAAVASRCGLAVERGTPGIARTTLPDEYVMPDPENWDYRVALGEQQAVLGYRDITGVPVTLLFADTSDRAHKLADWCHRLDPDFEAAMRHIGAHELPITEADLTHAVLLIVEACAEDNATHAPVPSEPFLTGDDDAESES